MKLSINEMYELRGAQQEYDKQDKRNFKMTLLLATNNKMLSSHISTFEEAQKNFNEQESVKKYMTERQAMIDKHRKKKTDGSFDTTQVEGKMMYRLDNVEALNANLDKFDKDHEKVIAKIEKHEKEIQEQIKEPVEIKLKTITKKEQIAILSAKTLVALAPIIKVKLTGELLEEKGGEFTLLEMERLMKYCTVQE